MNYGREMRFATLSKTTVRFNPEGYMVLANSKGNWLRKWLINKMWKWLQNCRALVPYMHEVEVYSFGPNEEKWIIDKIYRQIGEMVDSGYSVDDLCIVVGAVTFREITSAVVDDGMDFCLTGPFIIKRSDGHRTEIWGIPIHVVPRMEGICIIPKVIVEKEA